MNPLDITNNAMSNPQTLQMLSSVGLVPQGTTLLEAGSKEDFFKFDLYYKIISQLKA